MSEVEDVWSLEIQAARAHLDGRVRVTELVHAEALSARVGREVLLKLESRQRAGSFKLRPALNGMLAALDRAREQGVVASSSGNFATACAFAARQLDCRATIVMTPGASAHKRELTRALGAEIKICEDRYEARQETVDRLVRERGLVELHPHATRETIAGNATIALEILDEREDVETIVAPASGGGLVAGLALGAAARGRRDCVVAVQPSANTAFLRSLLSGACESSEGGATIADALQARRPAPLAVELARRFGATGVAVDDETAVAALRILCEHERLVAEPSSAFAIAAVLRDAALIAGTGPIAVVVSGGNVAPAQLARLLAAPVRG